MTAIKISSKVDQQAWDELRAMAEENHQHVSGLLTEAIREYVARRRVPASSDSWTVTSVTTSACCPGCAPDSAT